MNNDARILVVDDKESFRFMTSEYLSAAGYEVTCAGNAEEALRELARISYDLIVSDLVMPDIDGFELLRRVRKMWPQLPFILVTAHGSVESAVAAMKEGADDYLTKPLHRDELLLVVQRLLIHARLLVTHARMLDAQKEEYSFQSISSRAPSMGAVLAAAQQIAASPRTTVAIYGESGVGKEVLARAIHVAADQDLTTFIPVNCAAIPETLMESELFGHVKGAFTGADHERDGKCARARTGTLFLDEIGDMVLPLQAKLLRLLEERVYEKVGSDTLLIADFRVIVATHRNLDDCCKQGTFRSDLYHRINVFPIAIPPLRERREDIPQLAEFFLETFRHHLGKRLPGLSRLALDHLCAHNWPGNIRELRNRLEYAAIMSRGELIQPEHLRMESVGGAVTPAGDRINLNFDFTPAEFSFDAVNKRLITWAMEKSGNNKSAAARLLKATRKIFY
jgi:two-component system response regulator AtoC